MKQLKDYSEDIYKCTKCGLCQSVCPVFEATGLETAVSRGKFTLLNGILTGKIKFGKNISKYLDLCLGCKACFDFCPSGINAEEIIISARNLNYNLNGISILKKFIISNFDSKLNLNLLKFALSIYRNSELITLTNLLANKIHSLKQYAYVFNSQIQENIQYKKLIPSKATSKQKIVYFPGCINTYINQSVKNSVKMVLEKNGFEVQIPDFSCCGMPARSAGDFVTFKKQAEKNLALIDDDVDFILTDCASCGSVWDHYTDILDDDLKEEAQKILSKAVNINKFLAEIDLYIPENVKLDLDVTYHDPCHLKRFQNVYIEPRELLKKISGINLVEMKESDKCCGASGSFCVVNPVISRAVSKKKAENIIATKANIVATSCPSCKIGISQGLAQVDADMQIYQPVELLA
ncbi:MAG: (Fe-S)-binding protein, partial [Candidatus Gastranaerophilales bacterium]|nr:(Fe-S)-binding protein [Candidatus Gastranaerophilales bacterium]